MNPGSGKLGEPLGDVRGELRRREPNEVECWRPGIANPGASADRPDATARSRQDGRGADTGDDVAGALAPPLLLRFRPLREE